MVSPVSQILQPPAAASSARRSNAGRAYLDSVDVTFTSGTGNSIIDSSVATTVTDNRKHRG